MQPSSVLSIASPADSAIREAVIDHRQSFIVQAPAGSGKTELLIQRFLNLLAHADIAEPESILAITFTRKAAREMRNRILAALERVSVPNRNGDAESALTDTLAAAVLERDRQRGWGILENPARLQVRTLDSFCESIVRQMPILARFGVGAEIREDPGPLYDEAAERTLRRLTDASPAIATAIETLLLYLDNNAPRAQRLLAEMLQKRDQWMPLLGRCDRYSDDELQEFRGKLEASLARVVCAELTEIRKTVFAALSESERVESLSLITYAAENLRASTPASRVAALAGLKDFPTAEAPEVNRWLGVRDFFLTKGGDLRSQFTVRNGFPAGGVGRTTKQQCEQLFASLRTSTRAADLAAALRRIDCLPATAYTGTQWACVRALLAVLPLAIAELKVIFAEQGECDFVEVAQSAREALNPAEPSPIALSLGYRIQHILVDEFQDTSLAQVELLQRLTDGWATADDNTLFLVGDPMQSIYGFREAEVTLFEDARCGKLRLPALEARELFVNFRSTAPLVDWFNRVFCEVLREPNHVTGAIEYKSAAAARPSGAQACHADGVHLYGIAEDDRAAEGACVADIITRVRQARPDERIAILVRARTHLPEIVRALQAANIPLRAVKIEPLGERQLTRDLYALTLAITHPADRVAWLALLRSPVCGLMLPDLLELCRDDERATIPQLLEARCSRLSEDARSRCERLLAIVHDALDARGRTGLRDIVQRAWMALGGPAVYDDRQRTGRDAEAFFALLQQCEIAGDLADLPAFEEKMQSLFAPTESERPGLVDVMTIHNAKGLQWDTVILPGLARLPKRGDKQLLCWRELITDGEPNLLVATIDAPVVAPEENSIEDYLARLSADRNHEELKRLLYVACTRARLGLHLVAELPRQDKEPAAGSMLSLLWGVDGLSSEITQEVNQKMAKEITQLPAQMRTAKPAKTPPSVLRRLPLEWRPPAAPSSLEWTGGTDSAAPIATHTFDWAGQRLRRVGTATHRLLEQIGRERLDDWTPDRIRDARGIIRNMLLELGVAESELDDAIRLVQRALESTLGDERGRWILGAHTDAECELELSGWLDDTFVRVKIDRTFIDQDGSRWVIDYKTSETGTGDTTRFIEAQVEKFRPDLYRYRAIRSTVETRPIRLGLYFPLLREWREVP